MPPHLLLVLVLIGDAACIVGHLAMTALGSDSWAWHLGAEAGYGERYQNLKQVWALVLLALLVRRTGAPVLWAWLAVTAYFLVDDAGNVHEAVGRWVVANYLFAPGFGDQRTQLVEVLWMAGIGLLLAIAVLLTHRRSGAAARQVSRRLAVLYALLILVGVVLDGLHLAVEDVPLLDLVFTVAEDGGELVLFSVVVAHLFEVTAGTTTSQWPHRGPTSQWPHRGGA